jgi:O-antigen ligase
VITLHRYRTIAKETFLPDTSDKLDCAAFAIFLIFVAAAPFLYGLRPTAVRHAIGGGTVMPAGNMFLELFAFIVAAATFLSKSRTRSLSPVAIPLGAVVALALLGLVQLFPLPEKVLERAAPVNVKIYHETAEILGLFGKKLSLVPRISIAPAETLGTVLLVLAYTALFLSAASLLRNRLRRQVFSATLLGTAAIQILLAAIREGPEDRVHGVFVNPDHFAGYLEIGLALAFGALWAEVLTNSDRAQDAVDRAERFERRFVPLAGRILLWGLIAVGIGLTQSRGGLLSAAIMTLVLLTMAVLHRPVKSHWRAAVGVALAVLAGLVFAATTVGASPFLRFLQLDPRDLGANDRVAIWRTSLQAWREFPLLGSGLGTFREAFQRVQPRELSGLVEQAHSDSLQLLVTGGAIGAALGIIAFGSLFFLLARAWRGQRHREEGALVLAGFGALLSLTLHGLVDFNLSIPAIAATLACAMGAAWAAGTTR